MSHPKSLPAVNMTRSLVIGSVPVFVMSMEAEEGCPSFRALVSTPSRRALRLPGAGDPVGDVVTWEDGDGRVRTVVGGGVLVALVLFLVAII